MVSITERTTDLSAASPAEDSDAMLSPVAEPEPEPSPGLGGVPVRCEQEYSGFFSTGLKIFAGYDADRTESYTRIAPFQERHDTSVEYVTLSNAIV
ncbi:hypothetical protein C0989_003469 [Termitomyces sp. Mn162]|nr:hypothetical protein C0989_003469 [Termitomyces sp. Mn162]